MVAAAGVAAVSSAGAVAWADFWRKVRVFSRKRVRSTFFFFLGAGGDIGAVDRLGLLGAGAGVGIARLDVDESLLAHGGQILAHGRLHAGHVEVLLHLLLHVLVCGTPPGMCCDHLEDDEALPGANRLGKLPCLEAEGLVFQHLGQCAALELAQIAALSGCGAVAEAARQLAEVAAGVEFGLDVVGLGLGRGQLRRVIGLRGTRRRCRGSGVPVETRISARLTLSGCA